MTGKQNAQKRRRHDTEKKKMKRPDLSRCSQNKIKGHSAEANHSVVYPPNGHQEIPGLTIVSISTLGTSIEWSKPIVE